MTFKKLTLEDQASINYALSSESINIGEPTFTNLYIWRNSRDIEISFEREVLIIKESFRDGRTTYLPPYGRGDKVAALRKLLESEGSISIRAAENLDFFQESFSVSDVAQSDDDSDYIYSVSELINLSGRKFHKKKNHLNQFLKANPNYEYKALSKEIAPLAIEAHLKWMEGRRSDRGLRDEGAGIVDVLSNWQEFQSLRGGAVFLADELVAFSFGEALNDNMALIHIEKASPEVHGAYQIINQQILKHEFSACGFVNREQDLGIEGLRKAKMSYNPITLLKKFSCKLT